MTPSATLRVLLAAGSALSLAGWALAAPVITASSAPSGQSVAAAPLGGWWASADSAQDLVQVRDIRGVVRHSISRAAIQTLVPWMTLDASSDGPSAVGFSATGRLLFIAVHDDTTQPVTGLDDAILRLDVLTGGLTLFATGTLSSQTTGTAHLSVLHHRGRLYVGTSDGRVLVFAAGANQLTSTLSATWTVPGGASGIRGLAADRDSDTLFIATDGTVLRTPVPTLVTGAPTLTSIISGLSDLRGLTCADHFGDAGQRGLYLVRGTGGAASELRFLSRSLAIGIGGTTSVYTSAAESWTDVAFGADGALVLGSETPPGPRRVVDTLDSRLGFDGFLQDEFAQVVAFGRGLVAPDGEPAGWVIDADVIPSWSRFHPATPDGAAWVVLLLLMNERLTGDAAAQAQIRTILSRYAGILDSIRPVRNSDGIYKHWIDPLTGNTKATWPDEFATMSTMKITLAAARARARFIDDPVIARAASIIIFRTRNYDAYVQTGTDAMALKGLTGGGADTTSWSRPFQEGILYLDQAGTYGGATAQSVSSRWFNRSLWPTATSVTGRPITGSIANQFSSVFISVYPALVSSPFRADAAWRTQIDNIRISHNAWTDDNLARYSAVFSAGTSPSGYNADSLSNRPGNITTFTSLMGLSAFGETADAVGAYAAYRLGARQTFKSGASILYRRPVDPAGTFVPNSAGLPDVALGALALAELMQPGSIDSVLAGPYPTVELCPVDMNADGRVDVDDLYIWSAAPIDLNGDGVVTVQDARCFAAWLRRNESSSITGR